MEAGTALSSAFEGCYPASAKLPSATPSAVVSVVHTAALTVAVQAIRPVVLSVAPPAILPTIRSAAPPIAWTVAVAVVPPVVLSTIRKTTAGVAILAALPVTPTVAIQTAGRAVSRAALQIAQSIACPIAGAAVAGILAGNIEEPVELLVAPRPDYMGRCRWAKGLRGQGLGLWDRDYVRRCVGIILNFSYLRCSCQPVDSVTPEVKMFVVEAVNRLSNREVYDSVWNRSC
jgi:hypothetical protein